MTHEEWFLEAQVIMGEVARQIRLGKDFQTVCEVHRLRELCQLWQDWYAAEGDARIGVLERAENEMVFMADRT